jgi:hypothetical protein
VFDTVPVRVVGAPSAEFLIPNARAHAASPVGARDLFFARCATGNIRTPGKTEWREGSFALTPPVTRALLKTGLAVRRRLASAGKRLKGKVSRG